MLLAVRNTTSYTSGTQGNPWPIGSESIDLTSNIDRTTVLKDSRPCIEVCILESGISSLEERELREEKWICRLQTLHPTGINKDIKHYAKHMYTSFKQTL